MLPRPLTAEKIQALLKTLPGWKVNEGKLIREYTFPDFSRALQFVIQAGKTSERRGHHPDIELRWGYVRVTLWTHSLKGLSDKDFLLARDLEL